MTIAEHKMLELPGGPDGGHSYAEGMLGRLEPT